MKLDLHGLRHSDIEITVENFILLNQPPYEVITGNSTFIRNKVIEVLKKHKFDYMELPNNYGCLVVL